MELFIASCPSLIPNRVLVALTLSIHPIPVEFKVQALYAEVVTLVISTLVAPSVGLVIEPHWSKSPTTREALLACVV